MKAKFGLCALFLLLIAGGVQAQRSLDSLQELKQVDIVGKRTRTPSKTAQPLTPVQSLTPSDLTRLKPRAAGDAAKQFAGVNVKDYGGVGGMKTVSVRSLGAAHTAVSYDGILLADAQNGQIDVGKIYMDQVKSVSLYNAQGADLLQGARNFSSAALMQLETYSLADMDSAGAYSVGFDFGSFLSLSPSVSARKLISKNFGWSAAGRFDYIKGDYPFKKDIGGTVVDLQRHNADLKGANAEVNLFYLAGSKHRLDLKLFYYGSERGLPGAVINYYDFSAQRLTDHNFFGVLKHTWQVSPSVTMRNVLKYNFLYNHFLDTAVLSTKTEDDRYGQNEVYLSTATVYRTPLKGLEISGALDASFTGLKANLDDFCYPFRYALWFNVAAKYSHKYVEAMLSGLTSAYFDRVRKGVRPEDKARFSPFASIAVFPLGQRVWSIRVFYKDIFRVPTFNDLYYSRMGNVNLTPEKAKQVDVGTTLSLPSPQAASAHAPVWNVEFSADFYRNWVEDKIVAYPTTNLFIWSMLNLGKVEIKGMDYSLRAGSAFGREGLASRFRVDVLASYAYQYAVDRTDPDNGTYGHQIAYTPRHSGSGALSLTFPYGDISYRVYFSGERYALNENIATNRLAPYCEHGLGLNFYIPAGKRIQLEIGAEWLNFTGEVYEVVLNYPMPLANYRVHLKCRLK